MILEKATLSGEFLAQYVAGLFVDIGAVYDAHGLQHRVRPARVFAFGYCEGGEGARGQAAVQQDLLAGEKVAAFHGMDADVLVAVGLAEVADVSGDIETGRQGGGEILKTAGVAGLFDSLIVKAADPSGVVAGDDVEDGAPLWQYGRKGV